MKMLVFCADALNLIDAAAHGITQEYSQFLKPELPFTAPAWASIMTGLNIHEHGISEASLWNGTTIKTCRDLSPQAQARVIWKEINARGLSVGWWLIPVLSSPPPVLDGFSVSGGLWFPQEAYPSMDIQLPHMDHGFVINRYKSPTPGDMLLQDKMVLDETIRCLREETDLCLETVKAIPVDVLFAYNWAADMGAHWLYGNTEVFQQIIAEVAQSLARLQQELNPDITVIVSDHGGKEHPLATHKIEGILPRARVSAKEGAAKFALGEHHPIGMFSASRPFAPSKLSVYPAAFAYDWMLGLLGIAPPSPYSEEELAKIEEKLRDFGYL